jgi:hypothetical protein
MNKKYQIFVSSTFKDLEIERNKVIQTILNMKHIPAGMESFPAIDEEQLKYIKKIIDNCDYYIIIIGGRYGSLTEEGISFTESEYDYAISIGLKVIVLIHSNPDKLPVEKSDIDHDLRIKLANFRKKLLKNRLVKEWNNADELPGIVTISLISTINEFPAKGWSRDRKITQNKVINDLGVTNIIRSRNSCNNYFSQATSKAKNIVECIFITGGFIPGIELTETIAKLKNVQFNFYLLNPSSIYLRQRIEDIQYQYPIGNDGHEYQNIINLTKSHPERVSLTYYDEYPFWHYIMVDNQTIYISYNPIGKIGHLNAPIYVLTNNNSMKSLFNLHKEHIRILCRKAKSQ